MNIPVLLSLNPTEKQADDLLETVRRVNSATNSISNIAWRMKIFHPGKLHKMTYQEVRKTYKLPAQHVVKMLSRVTEGYRMAGEQTAPIVFLKTAPIPYDSRLVSFSQWSVSISTVESRIRIPYQTVDDRGQLLQYQIGDSWLFSDNGHWFLLTQVSSDCMNVDEWSDIRNQLVTVLQ